MLATPIRGDDDLKILRSIMEYGAYRGNGVLIAAGTDSILEIDPEFHIESSDSDLGKHMQFYGIIDALRNIQHGDVDGFKEVIANMKTLENVLREAAAAKGIDSKRWKPSKQTLLKHVRVLQNIKYSHPCSQMCLFHNIILSILRYFPHCH